MKRGPTHGRNAGDSFGVIEGVLVKHGGVQWGDYRRVAPPAGSLKAVLRASHSSAKCRSKPITLATKPFDHREGDA